MNICQMCFKLVYLFFFFWKQTLGETCYTPDKQQGRCVPLNERPNAFPTFANPPKGREIYLQRFLCQDDQQLKVCCGTAANFTLLENYLIDDYADIPKQIVERDDSFTDITNCYSGPPSLIDLPFILAESVHCEVKPKKCLGILANSRYVITPAQCVGQQFRLVGVQFRGKNNNSITFGVEEIISHPFFDLVSGVNDIALLRLNQTISSDDVAVLCRQVFWENGKPVFTYTNLDLSTIERGLNKTTVSIASLSKEDCEETFLQKGAYAVVTKYDLCTHNFKNATKSTCDEFTGVPLFGENNNRHGFIGFSSSRTGCDNSLPDIYTNVEAYSGWLKDQMRPWPTNNDPCTTPNGEIGECWNVYYCPALLDASLDVTNEAEAASLRGYICEEEQVTPFKQKLSVCCVTSSNSTVIHRKDEAEPIEVTTKFLEPRLCGLQHRDDYFTLSTALAIDEFPWIAGIMEDMFVYCTGTLINSRYLLTIATCVDPKLVTDKLLVRLGDYNQFNETSCVKDPDVDATDCTETEIYGIEDIIQHPFHLSDFQLNVNNIALLRLNKTVPYYTGAFDVAKAVIKPVCLQCSAPQYDQLKGCCLKIHFIRPICLPVPGTLTAKVGDTMYMSSWGLPIDSVGEDGIFGIKTKMLAWLIEKDECQRLLRKEILPNTFCTRGYENELHSGGALMFHDNYRWHIEGIVLYPYPNYYSVGPVVYLNVSRYINWIVNTMKSW